MSVSRLLTPRWRRRCATMIAAEQTTVSWRHYRPSLARSVATTVTTAAAWTTARDDSEGTDDGVLAELLSASRSLGDDYGSSVDDCARRWQRRNGRWCLGAIVCRLLLACSTATTAAERRTRCLGCFVSHLSLTRSTSMIDDDIGVKNGTRRRRRQRERRRATTAREPTTASWQRWRRDGSLGGVGSAMMRVAAMTTTTRRRRRRRGMGWRAMMA